MKRITTSLVLLLGMGASAAMAQSNAVFGGFSYLRGDSQLFNNSTGSSPDLLGWQASYTRQITPRFGLTGEFGGNYGPVSRNGSDYYGFYNQNFMQHTALGGPEVTVLKAGKLQINLRALAGIARANTPYVEQMTGYYDYRNSSTTAFAAALGGSADFAISPHVSIRLIQPEYFVTRYDNAFQDNIRVSAGIVFKFGD